jgi:hypothetical protein
LDRGEHTPARCVRGRALVALPDHGAQPGDFIELDEVTAAKLEMAGRVEIVRGKAGPAERPERVSKVPRTMTDVLINAARVH